MVENVCPEVCNVGLQNDLMTSFTEVDLTSITDRTCNNLLFLVDDAGLTDVNDATSGTYLSADSPRIRVVSSLNQVLEHWGAGTEHATFARKFFSNQNRGIASFYFVGYWDKAGGESIAAAADAINACNPCFLHIGVQHFDTATGADIIDTADMQALAEWANINEKICWITTKDATVLDPANASNIKATLYNLGVKDHYVHYTAGHCRVVTDPTTGAVMYFANGDPVVDADGVAVDDPANPGNPLISDGSEPMLERHFGYTALLAAAWAAKVDFSQTGSWYTLADKPLGGQGFSLERVENLDNSQVSALTGVLPDGTMNTNNNGHANTYVSTANYSVIREGISIGGSLISAVHLKHFIRQSMKDAVAAAFITRRAIPYDDARGQAILATAVQSVLQAAQNNGLFTNDAQKWEQSGAYLRKGIGYVIRQDSFNAQTAARRNQRLAPNMQACYIAAGAVHHLPVELCTLSVPTPV